MTIENSSPDEEFLWATFMNDLPSYVRLEFAGQSPEAIYPEWAFHIATSVECQNAYSQELRRQSLAQAADKVTVAQAGNVVNLLRHLHSATLSTATPAPAPSWVERKIEHGRAWLEAGTQRWRQVQLSLFNLHLYAAGQPAVIGLMSDERPDPAAVAGTLQVAPQDAGFELTIAVSPDPSAAAPVLYQAEVMLTLFDRFGDYAGVDLYLMWDETIRQATTDYFGRAMFTDLPPMQIKAMSLIVVLPNEDIN